MSKNFLNSSFSRWLTFYLLLLLAILLLIANLFQQPTQGAPRGSGNLAATPSQQHLTGTAVATKSTTATNPVSPGESPLELNLMQIDAQGLINNTASAKQNVSNQVMVDPDLKGRHAAFVIVYVGLDNSADPTHTGEATKVASRIEAMLKQLNTNNRYDVFTNAVYQSVVFVGKVTNDNNHTITGTSDLSAANLEIYLYSS
ncbi:MAG TPA: hypothetical protein VEH81_16130 [Ktedonobacteraceae bacterium]|nr:hypothetical protein [Ktedonobacteraceae bacterium]